MIRFLAALLFAGKFFAGSVSGSIAIAADAFKNLSDAGSSAITLMGFQLARTSLEKILHPEPVGFSGLSAAISAVLIVTLVGGFTALQIDGWCGILVALFILWFGLNSVRDTLPLCSASPLG